MAVIVLKEEDINGHRYAIGKMDAFQQFHVSRKLAPILAPLVAVLQLRATGDKNAFLAMTMGPFASILANMPNDDWDFILNTCLSVTQRKSPEGIWQRVQVQGGSGIMFDDMGLEEIVGLTLSTIQENLGDFFLIGPQDSPAGQNSASS